MREEIKKVLHITARGDLGGGPRHIEYLLNEFDSKVESYVACPNDMPFADIFKNIVGSENFFEIPHRKVSFSALFKLLNFIRQHRITLVHCHGKGASAYGKLLKVFKPGIKLVYTLHGISLEYSRLVKFIYLLFERMSTSLVSHVIFVSSSEKDMALQYGLYKNVKTTIIENGVPEKDKLIMSEFDKEKIVSNFKKDQPIVLTFSRFDFQKNMGFAYKIASAMQHLNFLWVGAGNDLENLKQQASSDGLANLYFVGQSNNVRPYLAVSSLYLSTSRWEGMPLALLEAMSVGLPVVASNVVGNKDVVNKVTGLLYDKEDLEQAMTCIDLLISKHSDKATENIIAYFREHYSAKEMASKTVGVYYQYI